MRRSPFASLLWAQRRRSAHALAAVRRESLLKVVIVSVAALGIWVALFVGADLILGLVEDLGAEMLGGASLSLGDLVMARLLSTLTLVLFVLLAFSNVLVIYASLFRASDMRLLVQAPIEPDVLFLGRFVEAVVFSSWATAFLGSPVMLSWGLATEAPPLFYPALLLFYPAFVILPAALAAIAVLLVVRWLAPRRHRARWAIGVGLVAAGALLGTLRGRLRAPDLADPSSLQGVFEALGGSQHPLLPSQWLTRGLLAAARGDTGEAAFHWLLLATSAALATYLAAMTARAMLLPGFSDVAGADAAPKALGGRSILGALDALVGWMPEPTRSMMRKDLRTFWRDPAQWSQFLLFFGILGVYLLGAQQNDTLQRDGAWGAWGSGLHLGATLLILASLTSRFIFPLVSLEGRRFWILGLAPIGRAHIAWQKFALGVLATAPLPIVLAAISARRLELAPAELVLSIFTIAASVLALSGLSVGLGALYPRFDDDSPARIVSGLGGTLNFLLGMLYIFLVLATVIAVLLRSRLDEATEAALGPAMATALDPLLLTGAAATWIFFLTALAVYVPMRLGIRHLQRLEL